MQLLPASYTLLTFIETNVFLTFIVFFVFVMAALRSRCGHYIFALWLLSFYLSYLWLPYVIGQAICIFILWFLLLLSFFLFFLA